MNFGLGTCHTYFCLYQSRIIQLIEGFMDKQQWKEFYLFCAVPTNETFT
jgi:hypothetical protein